MFKESEQTDQKVLVTGATGQLGGSVCRFLEEAGIQFLAVDKVPVIQPDFPMKVVDLLDREACKHILEGVNVLAHFANHSNWDKGSPQKVYSENVTMNMNLFQAAADMGCEYIIFSSTIQVFTGELPIRDRYGQDILLPYLPIDSYMPAIPRNSYALSKQATESMLKYFSATKGMTCVAIRYPWLLGSHLLKKAMDQGGIKRGKCYDGYAYLPLFSAAEVAIKAMTAELDGYHQYFVASKDNLEQRPVQELIKENLSHLPCNKPIEEMDSLVDCAIVEAELGWKQPQSLAESFQKYKMMEEM